MNTKLDQNLVSELAQIQKRIKPLYWGSDLLTVGYDGVHVQDVRKIEGVNADEIITEVCGKATVQLSVILHGVRFYSVHFLREA